MKQYLLSQVARQVLCLTFPHLTIRIHEWIVAKNEECYIYFIMSFRGRKPDQQHKLPFTWTREAITLLICVSFENKWRMQARGITTGLSYSRQMFGSRESTLILFSEWVILQKRLTYTEQWDKGIFIVSFVQSRKFSCFVFWRLCNPLLGLLSEEKAPRRHAKPVLMFGRSRNFMEVDVRKYKFALETYTCTIQGALLKVCRRKA